MKLQAIKLPVPPPNAPERCELVLTPETQGTHRLLGVSLFEAPVALVGLRVDGGLNELAVEAVNVAVLEWIDPSTPGFLFRRELVLRFDRPAPGIIVLALDASRVPLACALAWREPA